MEYHVYYFLKKFLFFGDGKYAYFSIQKVDGNVLFTDYWQVLVLNFLEIENTVFFEPKSWWKDDLYCLLKVSCFELFDDWKYGLFFSQKVDEEMIFTCRFELSMIFQDLGNVAFCAMIRLSYVSWNLSIVETVQMAHSLSFIFQTMLGDIIIMLDLPVGVSWWW